MPTVRQSKTITQVQLRSICKQSKSRRQQSNQLAAQRNQPILTTKMADNKYRKDKNMESEKIQTEDLSSALPAKKKDPTLLSLLIILLVVTIGAGAYFYMSKNNSSDTTPDQTAVTQTSSSVDTADVSTETLDTDIDSEISTTDKALSGIDDDADFGASTLSDTEVGL